MAWRYEFYFLVAKKIFYSLAALVRPSKTLWCVLFIAIFDQQKRYFKSTGHKNPYNITVTQQRSSLVRFGYLWERRFCSYPAAWLSWRQLKNSNTIGVAGDIMYLLGRTKLSRITSFQRIHYEKTNEDSASFRNCMSPRPSEPTAALGRFPKGFSTLRIKSRLFKPSFT